MRSGNIGVPKPFEGRHGRGGNTERDCVRDDPQCSKKMAPRFIKAIGGAAAPAAGGRLWHALHDGIWSAGNGAAYQAWRDREQGNAQEKLLRSAILAASAHNTQPWKFRVEPGVITVFADLERHIGSFDPYRREMHLSIGCALENLDQAARAQGLEARMELKPGTLRPGDPPGSPAAIVRLTPNEHGAAGLFQAIAHRHTHRGVYEPDREIPERILALMQQAVPSSSPPMRLFLFTGRAMHPLARLIVSATRAIVADRQMSKDNARWFRFRHEAVERCRDGLTLDANVTAPLANFAAKLFPPSAERADRHWLHDTEKVYVRTAPLLGAIAVRDLYDRPTALCAGRLWQRLHLLLTAHDIAAQPLNQPVERVDRERAEGNESPQIAGALARITGDPAWHATFIFRAGYAARAAPLSPRRDLRAVVMR